MNIKNFLNKLGCFGLIIMLIAGMGSFLTGCGYFFTSCITGCGEGMPTPEGAFGEVSFSAAQQESGIQAGTGFILIIVGVIILYWFSKITKLDKS